MKDKVKTALKRGTSGLLAVLLAVCLVGQPKAKAVVSETALLGSIFGSLLVSMGYSWAAENMDIPTFGESIYKLTQEFDEAMKDTGIQLIKDLNLAGLTANGAGKLQFGYAWVQAARSFAQWFEGKFFTGTNSNVVVSGNPGSLLLSDGTLFDVTFWDGVSGSSVKLGTVCKIGDNYSFPSGCSFIGQANPYLHLYFWENESKGKLISFTSISSLNAYGFIMWDGTSYRMGAYNPDTFQYWKSSTEIPASCFTLAPSLSAEKPQEVHYPDVAEDGSQVYEITVDGVTATDIEGIIQGAVDRILAGTAAIAGTVADAQAKPGEIVENPEIDPYKVGLSSVFPFCIPFDVYNMVTMFVAEPEAPSAEWTFTLPWSSQEYSVGWDLSDFDGVAQVCRSMQLVLFAVGLAVITYKVIKW